MRKAHLYPLILAGFALALLTNEATAVVDPPLTDLKIAIPLRIDIPAPEIISGITNPPLQGIDLNLGVNIHLDRSYNPNRLAPEGCILKTDIRAKFCLDPVAWPELLIGDILGDNVIYRGNQAIVRYDDERVSQAHILFPAERFIQVLEHLEKRYGPPTEQELFKTQIPEQSPIINTVVRWRSVFKGDKKDLILEVRAHDDTRRTFPDKTHGFMWLYRSGAKPVFRHLSVVDLMVLRKRRIGQWPYTTESD